MWWVGGSCGGVGVCGVGGVGCVGGCGVCGGVGDGNSGCNYILNYDYDYYYMVFISMVCFYINILTCIRSCDQII